MKPKFTIGDKVRIKNHKIGRCNKCKDKEFGFINDLYKLRGKKFTIEGISDFGTIFLKENEYLYAPCMLEKVEDLKECPTCGTIKESRPTPEGDEICPSCGDCEMMDRETPQPKECLHDYKIEQITTEADSSTLNGLYVKYAYLLCTKCPTVKKVKVNV